MANSFKAQHSYFGQRFMGFMGFQSYIFDSFSKKSCNSKEVKDLVLQLNQDNNSPGMSFYELLQRRKMLNNHVMDE